jgi:hypothetical protein
MEVTEQNLLRTPFTVCGRGGGESLDPAPLKIRDLSLHPLGNRAALDRHRFLGRGIATSAGADRSPDDQSAEHSARKERRQGRFTWK